MCDLMELYRYLVDDFVIQFSQSLKPKDFVVKGERTTRKRWGKREYLNGSKTKELERGLDGMFEGWVEVPRIRHGSRQTLEMLINARARHVTELEIYFESKVESPFIRYGKTQRLETGDQRSPYYWRSERARAALYH